jgi:hypothetical protein
MDAALLLLLAQAAQPQTQIAYKSTAQPIASSTTLAADNALFLPVVPDGTYGFLAWLNANGNTLGSGDLKAAFTCPAGASIAYGGVGTSTSTAGAANMNASRNASGGTQVFGLNGNGSGTAGSWAVVFGSIANGATAGNLQLEWAQNTSSSVATSMQPGSFLIAWQQVPG